MIKLFNYLKTLTFLKASPRLLQKRDSKDDQC